MDICHINRHVMKNGAVAFGSMLAEVCRPQWEDAAPVVIVV
ncbi:hypothetical protein LP7551_04317 [Roseibium album]|nr:hypothetical protein LP7551_04317 [Roseibium album]